MNERTEDQSRQFLEQDNQVQMFAESVINGMEFGDTSEVDGVLQKVISLASQGQASSMLPGAFVEKVAMRYYKLRGNVEPVFYLYRTFREQAKVMQADRVLADVGSSFGNTIGEIASTLQKEERMQLLTSSISFTKQENKGNSSDFLVSDLVLIASGLQSNGLNAECEEMCRFLIYLEGTEIKIEDSLMDEIMDLHKVATNPS